MIAETGLFCLILAFCAALAQGVIPLWGAARGDRAWMRLAPRAALLQAFFVALAFGALALCYAQGDFSVLNVARNSHSAKPLLYKITGVWGNHEGSMLLWVLILALYGAGVALWGGRMPLAFRARTLSVQAIISCGFLLFILLTSNPFLRLVPAPADGAGMNPLLQDPGLALHPPFLYLGSVGYSIVFSLAAAALIEGRAGPEWARRARPYALAAWVCLTIGIALGSLWAYYTLGWGGWWYWDPAENASFMPWLLGTALLHALIVMEKRGSLQGLTLFLAVGCFSLSMLGTFLIRSGVLVSVHSFATDPARGVFILLLLALTTGGALLLYALRAPRLGEGKGIAPFSRGGGIVLNNLVLCCAAASVLLGTLYPLAIEALGPGKISVGPPYFNAFFLPMMAALAAALPLGAALPWTGGGLPVVFGKRLWALALAALTGIGVFTLSPPQGFAAFKAACGMALAVWILLGALAARPLRNPGMVLAHLGLAVLIAGATAAETWPVERLQLQRPGESVTVGPWRVTLQKVDEKAEGPNYAAVRGHFTAERGGRKVELAPERRLYIAPERGVSRVALVPEISGMLYAVLGEGDARKGYVTRLFWHPLQGWIFGGALICALGGLVALLRRGQGVR